MSTTTYSKDRTTAFVQVGSVEEPAEPHPGAVEEPVAPPTFFQKILSAATALLTGADVSEERVRRRLEICSVCPKVKKQEGVNGIVTMICGLCGCKVKDLKDHNILNLARYEETKSYGCKFPGGSRWAKAGV